MKKSIYLLVLMATSLVSCTMSSPESKESAKVERINGLLIFVHSQPVAAYQVIGKFEHDAIAEIANEANNKKFGEALGDMFRKTNENLSMREQLFKMTELAKSKYPEAEALIINDKVFEAEVVIFR